MSVEQLTPYGTILACELPETKRIAKASHCGGISTVASEGGLDHLNLSACAMVCSKEGATARLKRMCRHALVSNAISGGQ